MLYTNLGNKCRSLGKHPEARENDEKALALNREIGGTRKEAYCHHYFAYDAIVEGNG